MIRTVGTGLALATLIFWAPTPNLSAFGADAQSGTYRVWSLNETMGRDPHETIDDVTGLTGQVGAPTMVTAMENQFFVPPCAIIFWNRDTNDFLAVGATGGFQFAVDVNRSTTVSTTVGVGFGGGDAWATVNGNSSFSPYMVQRGTAAATPVGGSGTATGFRWSLGASSATGVRVNSATGKVYLGNFFPGELIELDPVTDTVRKWSVGNRPYFLELDSSGRVYATATAGGGFPDQIIRLDPVTSDVTRWNIPGGGLQATVSFGTPNFITGDVGGNIWFTESASNEVGRLNPGTNVIDEFTKAGLGRLDAIASSGAGATLQNFMTETSGHVTVQTVSASTTLISTLVTPATATLSPSTSIAPKTAVTYSTVRRTILPTTSASTSSDGNGFDRFPVPSGSSTPTGMTRVAFPQTVFGSMEGSEDVFEFKSDIIVAPPPDDEVCGDGIDNDGDGDIDEDCPVTAGRMTGGGSVFAMDGTRVTHGFQLHCDAAELPNNLQVNWGKGNKFHLESLTSATCTDDPAIGPSPPAASFDTYVGEGTGRYNGVSGATIEFTFTDAGEPGTSDTATIEIKVGVTVVLSATGIIDRGNHQAHDD